MRVHFSSPTSLSILGRYLGVLSLAIALVASNSFAPRPASGQSTTSSSTSSTTSAKKKKKPQTPPAKSKSSKASSSSSHHTTSHSSSHKTGHKTSRASRSAQTARIHQAFVASSELRPMAQQLITLRTPTAYAGVASYAHSHTGDAAGAAYLSLGFAYQQDKRYSDAAAALRQAKQSSDVLADYADYLGAMNDHVSGNDSAAEALIKGFADRYPDSIFAIPSADLEANILLTLGDTAGAQRAIQSAGDAAHEKPSFELTQAKIYSALGQGTEATRVYKHLLLQHPLTQEAEQARAILTASGMESSLTSAELRSLADAYYNAGRYQLASEQYHALARNASLDSSMRNSFAVAAAACDWKLKRLSDAQARELPDTNDENGARRLYLLMELARDRQNETEQQQQVEALKQRFPQSPWLAEALFSSGNMYLLKKDYARAASYYGYLATHFPSSKNASAAHWRAGWLNYRQGLYADAAKIFDDQIRLFPTSPDTSAALYWRGRLYEMEDHKPALAAANYKAVVRTYQHFFYAQMARERLAALGSSVAAQAVSQPQLDAFQTPVIPHLDEFVPPDSPHIAKARLVANAGLNEYVSQEIAADPDSAGWSALAEAQIYASFGETYRAMRALKRAIPYAASAPIKSIPLAYWRILFPEAWWESIKTESAKNGLDPYLVASLIRQESEFNPSVVSYANAWGLMQIEPYEGKSLARQEGISGFQTFQLVNPEMNIRLGCRYLKQLLDRFGGVEEYALAAYNAGESRVVDWQAAGPYHGLDEFVESIPFTQTREYVQSILRNKEIYRSIDAAAASGTHGDAAAQ
jgi:soluble lytic murein transglycosylase